MGTVLKKHDVTQWIKDHSDQLFAFAMQRVRDRDEAADLVQETFVSAWRHIKLYNGKASPKTWLLTILKNKIIDHYRKTASKQTVSINNLGKEDAFFDETDHWRKGAYPSPWPQTESNVETKEFYTVFEGCKGKLKEVQAVVFTMKYVDGMDSEEICKTLSLTSSNYWVLIHRAKVQLRACLEMNWFSQ
jgi:RNA polymerase sigma-70 factor (ECF subfamily)